MASGAISAQGSKVYIGTGTGSAITITAISKAFHAEVTGANTLTKGDRVTFASVGGMVEINTLVGIVQYADSAKFVVDIDSRAFTTYTSSGTATPVTFTQIKGVKGFNPGSATVTEIDVTDLDSTAKEYRGGLIDHGDLGLDLNYVTADAGQAALRAAAEASLVKSFKVTTPDSKNYTFDAFCKSFPTIPQGAVDGTLIGTASVRITGAVTVS